MKRLTSPFAVVVIGFLALAPGAFAQAAKATAATPAAKATAATPATAPAAAPAAVAKARMSTPVKGTAYVEVIQGPPKKVGPDMVTVSKIKNVSNAPIAGLRVDEYWYNQKLVQVTGDTQRVRAPIAPGEIIEVTTKSPVKPDLYKSTLMFNHANGKVTAKGVKKFEGEKK
jgi:hypothetical protein